MFVTKTTKKPVKVLTVGRTKKAAVDALIDEVQGADGHPA